MKKSPGILSILCLLCIHNIFAQTDTLFVNEQGAIVSGNDALYFRIAVNTDSPLKEIREYFLNGKLRKVFHSASLRATLLQGEYTEYDDAGNVTGQGNYEKGFKTGDWIYFYPHSKRKKEKQVFTSPYEYYTFLYDSLTQKVESEGAIDKFGKRTGAWKQYHFNTDSVKALGNFLTGKREGLQFEYHKNGMVKRKEVYLNNKLQKGELFDEKGQKLKYFPAFAYPQHKEYLSNYLRRTEPCTAEALKKNDFKVRLTISKEGDVSAAEVMLVEQAECAEKIKAALLNMKKWKPALWENNPVKYTIEGNVRLYVPRD